MTVDGWCHERSAPQRRSLPHEKLGEARRAKHPAAQRMHARWRMQRVVASRVLVAGPLLEHGAIGAGATGGGIKSRGTAPRRSDEDATRNDPWYEGTCFKSRISLLPHDFYSRSDLGGKSCLTPGLTRFCKTRPWTLVLRGRTARAGGVGQSRQPGRSIFAALCFPPPLQSL